MLGDPDEALPPRPDRRAVPRAGVRRPGRRAGSRKATGSSSSASASPTSARRRPCGKRCARSWTAGRCRTRPRSASPRCARRSPASTATGTTSRSTRPASSSPPARPRALLLAIAATTDPGDEVILADPSYPCNREMVESFGGRVVAVPADRGHPLPAFDRRRRRRVERAHARRDDRLPVEPDRDLDPVRRADRDLRRSPASRDAWRIVDEIYLDLADPAPDGTPPRSVLIVDPDAIVINSFSKYFGMTGWRLGWAVLPEALVPASSGWRCTTSCPPPRPPSTRRWPPSRPSRSLICEERRAELAARRALVLGRARAHRPARPGHPGRRVLRLLRRRRHRPQRLGVLRPRARRDPRRAHPRDGLRRPHRRHPRPPLLRRVPRGAARRAQPARGLRRHARRVPPVVKGGRRSGGSGSAERRTARLELRGVEVVLRAAPTSGGQPLRASHSVLGARRA